MPKRRMNPLVKQQCREMYFKYVSVPDISRVTGIKEVTIRNWINRKNGWQLERAKEQELVWQEQLEANKVKYRDLIRLSYEFVRRAVVGKLNKTEKDGKTPYTPSMQEAYLMTNIVTSWDKMGRLDMGEATDIVKGDVHLTVDKAKNITMKELYDVFKRDPFLQPDKPDIEMTKGITAYEPDLETELARHQAENRTTRDPNDNDV